MNRISILIFFFFLPALACADINIEPLLNKISLQLQSEQWVTTKTALVSVGVNASVTDQGIEKIQADVMQKLSQLAKGDWHIVSFARQQDKSGLESIQISAQARLAQTDLANLRNTAKTISKPGETFTIDNVQFTPSDDELKQANINLRNNIYQQAKAEINLLNSLYPDQKYYLHEIDFAFTPPAEPMPMAANMMYKVAGVASATVPSSPPLAVGNKVQLNATVIISSVSDQLSQKLNHT